MNFSLSSVMQIFSLLPSLDAAWGAMLNLLIWAVHHPAQFIACEIVGTWVYYLAMCSLKRANDADKIPQILRPLCYVLLGGFLLADAFFNVTVGTIFFLQLPRQWLFTARCKENKQRWDWRGRQADFWCANMLNPFDPSGRHC